MKVRLISRYLAPNQTDIIDGWQIMSQGRLEGSRGSMPSVWWGCVCDSAQFALISEPEVSIVACKQRCFLSISLNGIGLDTCKYYTLVSWTLLHRMKRRHTCMHVCLLVCMNMNDIAIRNKRKNDMQKNQEIVYYSRIGLLRSEKASICEFRSLSIESTRGVHLPQANDAYCIFPYIQKKFINSPLFFIRKNINFSLYYPSIYIVCNNLRFFLPLFWPWYIYASSFTVLEVPGGHGDIYTFTRSCCTSKFSSICRNLEWQFEAGYQES